MTYNTDNVSYDRLLHSANKEHRKVATDLIGCIVKIPGRTQYGKLLGIDHDAGEFIVEIPGHRLEWSLFIYQIL